MSETLISDKKERKERSPSGLKKRLACLAVAFAAFDAYAVHHLYTMYKDNQKETTTVTSPDCVDFMRREDFFYDMTLADACAEEQRARIALIDFRSPDAEPPSSELAAMIGDELAGDSGGYLIPQFEVVEPAHEVLDEIKDYTCDPSKNSTLDNIAYYQGRDLREQGYDKVLALTPLAICRGVLGYAATGREIAIVGQAEALRLDTLVQLSEHEVAHLYGIGHSGVLRDGEQDELVLNRYMYNNPRFRTSVDITSLIQGAQLDEYGDSSYYSTQYGSRGNGAIMGSTQMDDGFNSEFSDFQLLQLSAVHGVDDTYNADKSPVRLEADAYREAPIQATVGNIQIEDFGDFNRLLVYPQKIQADKWTNAEVSLVNDYNHTLLLGGVYFKTDAVEGQLVPLDQSYTFIGSEAAVSVSFREGAVVVERTAL